MRIWNDLLYLFFPRLCLLCRRPLVEGEEHICLHCAEDLPYTYYIDVHGNPVYRLFKERFPVEAVTAFLFFKQGGSAQTLIHALKYDGNRQLGYHLGRMAALEYRESGSSNYCPICHIFRSYGSRWPESRNLRIATVAEAGCGGSGTASRRRGAVPARKALAVGVRLVRCRSGRLCTGAGPREVSPHACCSGFRNGRTTTAGHRAENRPADH